MNFRELNRELGNIDLYLLDAILKGYFSEGTKILDAGCGEGRNLVYFLKNGFECYGVDNNAGALRMLRYVLNTLSPGYPASRFSEGDLKSLPYEDNSFDAVICSAVLHFAESVDEFYKMFGELVRVLRPEGKLFIRMTDDTTMENAINIGKGKFQLPDGSVRFLLTSELQEKLPDQFSLKFIEPYKSLVVKGQRSMNVMLLQK